MKTKILLICALLLCQSAVIFARSDHDGRIKKNEILTPLPSQSPKINGPKVYGARAGREFLFRIPCQGVRPIQFNVEGLPSSLTVSEDGIISGRTPFEEGEYKMIITATNAKGSVTREFNLVVGDKLALTPPTGFNTWGGYMLYVSDSLMRSVADFFIDKGLADVGYQYIGIDDCWMRVSPEMYKKIPEGKLKAHAGFNYSEVIGEARDSEGNVLPNSKFPDMKGMTDYIHSKGLKAGIYSGPGEITCQKWTASLHHEVQDAKTYAEWGFDLLKYDMCSGSIVYDAICEQDSTYRQRNFWETMAFAIKHQDHDILFNLCQYGKEDPWIWAPTLGIQTWRCTGDLNHHVENYFQSAVEIATTLRDYNKPGQWSDPDFMYIQYIRKVSQMGKGCVEISLNTNQRYQYVTLWSMICAPFVFATNIEMMDEFTLRLLSNTNLMNINQDELGHTGEIIRNKDNQLVMVKNLADGSKAIALFNTDAEKEAEVNVMWSEFDDCCEKEVYDAWREKDLGIYKGGITSKLSPNGVALFIVK